MTMVPEPDTRDGREWLALLRRHYHHVLNGGALSAQDMGWHVEAAEQAQAEIERLRRCLSGFAEGDCYYGDGCPKFGSRHGQCQSCRAREALRDEPREEP